MSKFDWKAWTAGESGEQLAKHKEDAKQNEKKQ